MNATRGLGGVGGAFAREQERVLGARVRRVGVELGGVESRGVETRGVELGGVGGRRVDGDRVGRRVHAGVPGIHRALARARRDEHRSEDENQGLPGRPAHRQLR